MLQDLWVLSTLGGKPGFFVDVGAAYPRKYSNSWTLQEYFQWKGLLIEANPQLAQDLRMSRSASGVNVIEVAISTTTEQGVRLVDAGPMSSLLHTAHNDHLGKKRIEIAAHANPVFVNTSTLSAVLESCDSPRHIDFLSIDIEGADFEALNSLDFSTFSVGMIAIEHNFNFQACDRFEKFLTDRGYVRVARRWSSIDAWFIHSSVK